MKVQYASDGGVGQRRILLAMVQERIEDILRGMGAGQRPQLPSQSTQPGRRRTGSMDTGTVALGLTAMTYYWLMPALMSRRKRRRKTGAAASKGQPPAQA